MYTRVTFKERTTQRGGTELSDDFPAALAFPSISMTLT